MLHPTQGEREERKGQIGRYELLLPKDYPRPRGLQGSIAERLGLFALAKCGELRAALERRLKLTEELLEAIAQGLRRSEIPHRRVIADRIYLQRDLSGLVGAEGDDEEG
ncbi:MAG: hypothetical protein ACE5KR_02270 [Candidatus Bipolaricaulia bacterium]